ncbi:MAG: ribonuclease P protein component [Alistipes sp.]|nr:ribonuclease P protein component [Alistipes sp.]
MQNRPQDTPRDATLPKRQRLSGTKAIEQLFRNGKGGFVYPFRYIYTTVEDTAERLAHGPAGGPGPEQVTAGPDAEPNTGNLHASGSPGENPGPAGRPETGTTPAQPANGSAGSFQVLFSVPKRYHKRANKRNLLKRRSRESFRQAKQSITASVRPGKQLRVALIYSSKEVEDYRKIDNAIRKIIPQLRSAM